MLTINTGAASPVITRTRGLIIASHPGPCLAVTALVTVLTLLVNAVMIGAAGACSAGLKSTWTSGLVYLAGSAAASRRWVPAAGLAAACGVAMVGCRGSGKVPFVASPCIAAVNVALLAAGSEALT